MNLKNSVTERERLIEEQSYLIDTIRLIENGVDIRKQESDIDDLWPTSNANILEVVNYERNRILWYIGKMIEDGVLPKEGTWNDLMIQHYRPISILLNKYFRNFQILSALGDGRYVVESYWVELICEIDGNNLVSIDWEDDLSEVFSVEQIILRKMLLNKWMEVTHDENGFSFYVDGTSKISWLGVPDKEWNLLVHINNIRWMQEWSHPYVSLYLWKRVLSSKKLNIIKVFENYRTTLLK